MAHKTVLKNVRDVVIFSIILAIVLEAVEGQETLVVQSPNFPYSYPNNYKDVSKLEVPFGYNLEIVFNDFKLESSSDCSYDYIALFDGPTENHPLLGKFCGNEIPRPIKVTKHGVILLVFRTDGSTAGRGFRVTCTTRDERIPKLTQYFLNAIRQQTRTTNKWGMDITRTAVALFLADAGFFAAGNGTGEEIAYELSLQLMSKLVMKKRISSKDLALFINAMTVACVNPKQFFGLNIVAELRRRIENNNRTNPFLLLALCIGGENMTTEDAQKLQHLFRAHAQPSSTETQAMVVMALKCISSQPHMNLNGILEGMVSTLKTKQENNGTIENLKTTALVIQALIATESYETNFNVTLAISAIFKDIEHANLYSEDIYYILPILKKKSLLNIKSSHCGNFIKTELEPIKNLPREVPDERIHVQISIIIGDDMDFTRTWRIKVPSNHSCYDVINNISSSNTRYKVQYKMLGKKPYIVGLSNYQNSVEDGLFWFSYSKPMSSDADLILIEESPVDIQVNETYELILWYSSGLWPSTREISSNAPSADTTGAP